MSRTQRRPKINRTKVLARLQRALDEQLSVQVLLWYEGTGAFDGFVTAIGTRWVAIARLDDGKEPDGWELVRVKDIQKVWVTDDPEAVQIRVMQARGHWPLAAPPLDLTDASSVLRSAGSSFELISVHAEKYVVDAMWVGAVIDVSDGSVRIEALDATAAWDDEVFEFRIRDISRVTVSDAYAAALDLVAGPQPVRDPGSRLPLVPFRNGWFRRPKSSATS